jgi:hypothetical protein
MHGKKYMGTERTTYLIDPDRRIKAILKKLKPAEHVTQLLKALVFVDSGLAGRPKPDEDDPRHIRKKVGSRRPPPG